MTSFFKLEFVPRYNEQRVFLHLTYKLKSILVEMSEVCLVEEADSIKDILSKFPDRFPSEITSAQEFTKIVLKNGAEMIVLGSVKFVSSLKKKRLLFG
jgi:hypothetical protein